MDADRLDPTRRFWRDDATHLIWIVYGLSQALLTMLYAFDALTTTTASAVVTGVALIVYVAVNELLVRPSRRRDRHDAWVDTAPQ